MTAERAERLFDGLLVADIGINGVEEEKLRAALGRDVESALRHESKQADGFQRDGLTTCVGTSDDNGARAWFRIDVNGDNGRRVQQGMARLHQAYRRSTVNGRLLFAALLLIRFHLVQTWL